MRTLGLLRAVAMSACMLFTACGGRERDASNGSRDERFVALDLDRRGTDEVIGYYMGAFLPSGREDPFETRLVVKESDEYFVDIERFMALDSASAINLVAAAPDGSVDWDAFTDFVSSTYFRARGIPTTRLDLDEEQSFAAVNPDWMSVDVIGVMSTQRRRVFVRRQHVIDALRAYRANEDRIIYPDGTVFIGEHLDGNRVSETTVMRKSSGGFWDFFAYDSTGALADSTLPMPGSRHVPTQCFGCHFGDKLYEPERSFPGLAPDGPYGPRELYVGDSLRDPDVVRYFDEHRQRSDGVLGLYATLLVSELRAEREQGRLDPSIINLLESLGL